MSGGGVRVAADGISRRVGGGRTILDDVTLAIEPGELVAIVGGSGAGKTTLLEALAGVRPADAGCVTFDGVDLGANLEDFRAVLGFVPQDDIVHTELPLRSTLRYAARLRRPPGDSQAEVEDLIDDVLDQLDLTEHSEVRVGALSGGQRKRASIAVELLTQPQAFFLDEPTSGLDPATSAGLLRVMKGLSDGGATVIFTTHAVQDLARCDRVVFMARGGHLAFVGTVDEALPWFEVDSVERIYERLADDLTPAEWADRYRAAGVVATAADAAEVTTPVAGERRNGPGFWRQWQVLTARTAEATTRNRLTLAILVGTPVLVVAMFATLFRPDAFLFSEPDPTAIGMIIFWMSFAGFFFGLTYGLLQIVTERAIVRREYMVGERIGAYLLAKVTVLIPFLALVTVLMLAVLRLLGRLPEVSAGAYLSMGVSLMLVASAALALGLMTSAAVRDAAQATLALPLLCFPAVLFSGAIVPVHLMASAGGWISVVIPTRWGFEALGQDLDVRELLTEGGSPLGPPLLATYGDAGTEPASTYWGVLAIFIVLLFAGAWLMLRWRCRQDTR